MKKIFLMLAALLLVPLAQAAPLFKEGVHYEIVKQAASAKPEVTKFFSYYCPHCFQFEPIFEKLQAELPEGVTIKGNPVAFLGKDMGSELQRAYALATLLKVEPKISAALFQRIQVERKLPQDRDEVKALFESQGVTAQEFDGGIDSFAVTGLVAQYDRNTQSLNIRGVPATVVNGKYLVKSEALTSAEEYVSLVKFLLAKQD